MKKIRLPEMIDYFRKENGWTMKEFGEKLGKSESAISKWIKGVRSPMVEDFDKMVNLFNTDPDTLMYGASDLSTTLSEINKISSQLEEPRQKIVLNTATNQLDEQEEQNKVKQNKVKQIEDYRLSDEYLEEQISKASAYGGGQLNDNDKEFFKRLLKNTLKEKIDKGDL